ncbi:N-acyl-D-amino-acid deacylase family protein [Paraburkholderia susongensis]|uniref:N-acyl-D-amino-acid deacylase n=1 Tax=Paraburkholderia susongensis TaxID=1515439 RepID=A0A1X7LNT6_9BURK|nr:D-aminoacylase [Paraburkholderia susongensis]SMG54912.1 N-acyl-D-amino-acid deacylase [Paraburkholderia susongensis]
MSKPFDIVISGGTVVDGSRGLRFDADVGIVGDRVVAIGDMSSASRNQTIDATGRIVAPGFIDVHTHDDQAVIYDPAMTAKVSQGVTTVVTGNCGISAAPLPDTHVLPMPLSLLGRQDLRFATFRDYLDHLRDSPLSVNVIALVGHSSLRACTMDDLSRAASEAEIASMRDLLSDALDAGAFGLSTGLAYPTAINAPTAEVIEVGRPLTKSGGLYVSHMRNESDNVMDSLSETFEIGRELGVSVVVSHHKIGNRRNFGATSRTLPYITSAMEKQSVCLDCYPYDAGSTMISTDPNMLDGRVLIISSEAHPECAGRDLDDIASDWGVGKVEAARRLQPGSAIYFLLSETDVRDILRFPHTMVGSDGLPGTEKPHPRLWGTFPRVLGRYCRDLGLFPLETAVWKMTGLTAKNFGLVDRGVLKAGSFADIVVFDYDTVNDRADYQNPTLRSSGIDIVIANGSVIWQNGEHTNCHPGRVLTRTAEASE